MKKLVMIVLSSLFLTGCGTVITTKEYINYLEAVNRSANRESGLAQTACWNAVSEVAKTGDQGALVAAITMSDKCKK